MNSVEQYINETLGTGITLEPINKSDLGKLPMYLGETYSLQNAGLFNNKILLATPKQAENFSILQIEKHFETLRNAYHKKPILALPFITSVNRTRLIKKGINFIVPGKQLYLPDLLIDLNENFINQKVKPKNETLLPSAQLLLIYHILHRDDSWKLEDHAFKEIAEKMGYSAMAISKAVENLKHHDLIDISGEKEKFIHFRLKIAELWREAEHQKLLINPVSKSVYVDEKPNAPSMLQCNSSALPEYSDMNPSRQEYYAIEKNEFYALQKSNSLVNVNDFEGKYCLEVWKYNPLILANELHNDRSVVDPLSLYLSLTESHDERFEQALEQITDKYIW